MNGVHLRAARIARGGIRASDRPDDFRAEILGLMRTQIIKNAVIVPSGAKGGFIIKRSPRGTPADAGSVEAVYRQFISALLSITDNRANGQTIAPAALLVYDEPDPYLVVAADKGTATFSDIANAIAAGRDFWLGDAFASGGQHGYDHKRLGITARGAWECAREHFRDMGRDLDHSTVSVVGIGDMSGDVFGNGLLRSRHLRLLAAFNHRDIFLDPDPDPELSYRERERLFHLPGSGWTDYAPQSFSRGGGVYARAAKSIALSPEARAMLGITAEKPSGEDVIRAILRLPVELLWNGGVGTYVKASDESHSDVGDPGNDAVRIDARELRATVVVEGGNLGVTQRGRVEYAMNGGRINTDAIDNSGGVDLSDHEVNLKIALHPAVATGALGMEQRNVLLAEVADAVSDAVLAHNRSQARALTLEQVRSRTQLAPFRDLMTILETEAGLDRPLVQLPSREALRARRSIFLGLTRPELAVLMAHTKIDLRQRLGSALLDDEPELERYLHAYFPGEVAQRFAPAIAAHPLRREIVALTVGNELIDTMGMTFLVRAVRDTGRDVLDVVRAWVAARAIIDAVPLYAELRGGRLSAAAEQRGMLELASAIERTALWLVRGPIPGRPLAATIDRFREPVGTLLTSWSDLLPPGRAAAEQAAADQFVAAGLEPPIAARLARLRATEEALEIAHIAQLSGTPPVNTAEAYLGTASLVDVDWLRDVLPSMLPGEDRWEPRAVASLLEVVLEMRRLLTQQILAERRSDTPIRECLERYAAASHDQLAVVSGLINDQKGAAQPTLPALVVVIRELGRLVRPPNLAQPW
jgi:glutamate dehydrogenase